jgi:HTH-type transcriptional regulator/antitoxin MqsA
MLKTCTDCGGAIARRADTFDAHIGRRTVSVPGEYDRCAGCGEFYFAPGEMDEMMKRASGIVRAGEGLLLPSQIKAFRKGIGLTQPQLEDLLGAGPKTVGRWEKGTVIQNGATDTLLRLLMDMPEALQHLLAKRGIVPNIVPLVPARRAVSYQYPVIPGSSPRFFSESFTVTSHETLDMDTPSPVQNVERIA